MNEDLIDACVMETYFREHMAERGRVFHFTTRWPRTCGKVSMACSVQAVPYESI